MHCSAQEGDKARRPQKITVMDDRSIVSLVKEKHMRPRPTCIIEMGRKEFGSHLIYLHHGGGSVIMWTCVAAKETDSVVFTREVTVERSSRINTEAFIAVLSAQIQVANFV